jgi:hypothetical protein
MVGFTQVFGIYDTLEAAQTAFSATLANTGEETE